MNIFDVLKHKSFWGIVVMFLIGGIGAVHNSIPANWLPFIDFVVGSLSVYFLHNTIQVAKGNQ